MSSRVNSTGSRAGYPQSSFKYTPLEHVRTLYVRFTQGLFHALPPGFYHWELNPADTQISITDENPIKLDEVGTRPAISFTRGPVQFYSLGLGDLMDYSFQTGKEVKSALIPGTMHINCCSRVDIEADNIAWFVAEQLWLHRAMLMQAGFFEIGRQPVIGACSRPGTIVAGDSADEWYCTTVACPFQFYRTSQTTPLNTAIAKNIAMSLQHNNSPLVPGHEIPTEISAETSPFFNASDVYGGTPNPADVQVEEPQFIPHPLNPAKIVRVRSSRAYGPALRPPSIGGRVLPILRERVEESLLPVALTSTSKHRV